MLTWLVGYMQNIATFYSDALAAVGGTTAGPGVPVRLREACVRAQEGCVRGEEMQ